MKKAVTIGTILTSVLLVLVLAALFLWQYFLGGFTHVSLDPADLGIEEIFPASSDSDLSSNNGSSILSSRRKNTQNIAAHAIKNIAVFGLSVSEVGGIDKDRSDMNLIVSLDPDQNRVALTSILRDTKAPIEGHSPQKINAAYKYGGPALAIKTLNQNFHLNIADYITVNFENLIEIVDDFGGVDVELTAAEAQRVPGSQEGWNHLNGEQALKYASIRYIDSDYYRASRQQTIMLSLFDQLKNMPASSYASMIRKVLNCVESSMDFPQIWQWFTSFHLSSVRIDTNTIPDREKDEGLWGGIDETGSWVWIYDLEAASDRLKAFIYEME